MNRLLIIISIFMTFYCALNAQENVTQITLPSEATDISEKSENSVPHRVYAELLGTGVLGFNKNVVVSIDLGQYQSSFKPYRLLDEKGKPIKFNSMVAAMNYMGERGWKFIQVYIVKDTSDNQDVFHWLMYKDITAPDQIYDGLRVSNTESAPSKSPKNK